MITNNHNPLGIVGSDVENYNHRKWYAYGNILPVFAPVKRIIPFSVIKESGTWEVDTIRLYEASDNTYIDIKSSMEATGFQKIDYDDYSILEYPGTKDLTDAGLTTGDKYLLIGFDDGTYLYFEIFRWLDKTDNLILLEWFHQENFTLPFGIIRYKAPFKFKMWIDSTIAKPDIGYEETVQRREGRDFKLQQIKFKRYFFEAVLAEYMVDALSFVRLHDCCSVTYKGVTHSVDDFIIDLDWQENGDICVVTVEFRTDTVIVVNAKGITTKDYDAGTECLPPDWYAEARINAGSDEYNGFYYLDTSGSQVDLIPGQYLLIRGLVGSPSDTNVRLYGFDGVNYALINPNSFDTVYNRNDNEFLFHVGITDFGAISITSVTVGSPSNVKGLAFKDSLVEIWGKDGAGNEELLATGTDSDFLFSSTGIDFEFGSNIAIQARSSSYACDRFSLSGWDALGGIGVMEITTGSPIFEVQPDPVIPDPDPPFGT